MKFYPLYSVDERVIIGDSRHHVAKGTSGIVTDLFEGGYAVKIVGDYMSAANKKVENGIRILWFPPHEILCKDPDVTGLNTK